MIQPLFAKATFSNDKAFTASPNPTSGVLIIVGKDITHITVYDVLGKQVTTNNYSTLSSVEMNISSLKNGVYMVKVTNANGNASTIKVVKQ